MISNQISEIENARKYWSATETRVKLEGVFAEAVRFLERNQICEVDLWKKIVEVYRTKTDSNDNLWRCEYWGKMMRGASMIVKYTQDKGMYRILENAVRDILTVQDEYGRISTYTLEKELWAWDMWGRKYILLGMQYFLEICRDEELAKEILVSMRRQADYILDHVGTGEGKIEICKASKHWEGLNSCSILEPMVRLYRLTGEKKYLDFGTYIISTGFIESADLIELAYEDKVAPYQYPVVKAYEMMSCFEGLIQYYYVTGIEKYKTAALNFGKKIIETEISVIGCSGCTHELFDHTAERQTQTDYDGVVQETCVGVTWMKLASALLQLSGEATYADHIEHTFYNNYLGSMNTRRNLTVMKYWDVPQVLPFDSYSPLTPDCRGKKVGGYCPLPGGTFYGCCACIGAAGAGVIPQMALLRNENGFFFNFYAQGSYETQTPNGKALCMKMETEYPKNGKITVTVSPDVDERFGLSFRIPAWCKKATLAVNGEGVEITKGYTTVDRVWRAGDAIELELSMMVEQLLPPEGAVNREMFAAYRYGPMTLAADKRITDPMRVILPKLNEDGSIAATKTYCPEIPEAILCFEVACEGGDSVRLVDYSSAGKTWDEDSLCAAWLYRR